MLKQRVAIITLLDATNPMSEDISAVRLVPSDYVTLLLGNLPQFSKLLCLPGEYLLEEFAVLVAQLRALITALSVSLSGVCEFLFLKSDLSS